MGVQIFYSRYHISSLLPLIPLLEEGTIIFFVQGKNLRPRVCPKSQLFNVNVRIQTQVRCQILGLSSTQCCFSLGKGSLLVLLNRKTQISTLDASVSLPPLLAPYAYTMMLVGFTFLRNIPQIFIEHLLYI